MTKSMDDRREELQQMNLPELADLINGLEGFAWRLEHDSADGRIEHDISDDCKTLRDEVNVIAQVFAEKSGVDPNDREALGKRIRAELAKYERMLGERWKKLFRIGATFVITGGDRLRKDITDIFEVVAIYETNWIGPDQFIFARMHNSGVFTSLDNRDISELRPVKVRPQYRRDESFVRAEDGQISLSGLEAKWTLVNRPGTVFSYNGPRKIACGKYETFYGHQFWRVGSDRDDVGLVVIARAHNEPKVAEFVAADLPHIRVLPERPKYVERDSMGSSIPVLNIFKS